MALNSVFTDIHVSVHAHKESKTQGDKTFLISVFITVTKSSSSSLFPS